MSCRRSKYILFVLATSFIITNVRNIHGLSSLAKNDAFPVFSTLDPHFFLYDHERLSYKDPDFADEKGSRIGISISPYAQNADRGKNFRGERFLPQKTNTETCQVTGIPIELSDLTGRVNMIALLYGSLPEGQTLPPTLEKARMEIFPGIPATTPINDASKIDPLEQFASLSFPLKYRKRGVRFDLYVNIIGDFGLNLQTGVASICQTVTAINDLTCNAVDNCPFEIDPECSKKVRAFLTSEIKAISQELGVDICDFGEASIEEIRLNLYWRHAYELNHDKEDWPHILFMPFAVFSASASPGKKRNPSKLFAIPFGNDDHSAIGITAGFAFDFIDTIEIAGEVGATHFFSRCIPCLRIPNSLCQKTLFPFTASATVSPGHNWHFGGKITAYHFLGRLSAYFQYLMLEHEDDTIKLKKPDPAFKPEALEKVTGWKIKIANIGFNYDISPNVGLGFLWQAPLSQRNTYRSSTVMFSFNATF